MQVCAALASGRAALDYLRDNEVDVILLDVVMAGMDGYETTRTIMATKPTPIVLVSGVVDLKNVSLAMEALRAGALATAELLPAPTEPTYPERRAALARLLRAMAKVRLPKPRAVPTAVVEAIDVIGIGASIGGPPVVAEILSRLPIGTMPPILLVQHIASGFEQGFAEWLAATTRHPVRIAQRNEVAARGGVYVAPGGAHLQLSRSGTIVLSDDPPIGVFRPSATALLRSLVEYGSRAIGVVLTGIGEDGAQGAAELAKAGGMLLVQDEASSTVHGMPSAVLRAGVAARVLTPREIAEMLATTAR